VLGKGLTFCPTPSTPDLSQIWLDFKDLHRRLELRQFFKDIDSTDNIQDDHETKFAPKSIWRPPITNKTLEAYRLAVRNDLATCPLPKDYNKNLSIEQTKALTDLCANPDIIIKKADKGSTVVVMNTTDYLREGLRQLQDKKFYKLLDHDPTEDYAREIDQVLLEMRANDLITSKNYDYLKPYKCEEGRFYMLKKIHKTGAQRRPICSTVGHPTNRISQFVDENLKRYVPNTRYCINDTTDFIEKIYNIEPLPHGTILATMDVTSLYANIPTYGGLVVIAD
jgi:hypothetical protein